MTTKPSRTQKRILAFLDTQYAQARKDARESGEMLVNIGAPQLGVPPEKAQRHARIGTERAALLQRFLDDTIRPHLGSDGPLGDNADRQLRLLAWGYSDQPGYDDAWQPNQ